MTAVPQMNAITASSLSACLMLVRSFCTWRGLAPLPGFLLMYLVYRAQYEAHKPLGRVYYHIAATLPASADVTARTDT